MSLEYPVWTGEEWINMPIPAMGGEGLVVPNVAAVVYSPDRETVLLQRRDKPDEVVRGRLEIPGGRWRAGESAEEAVRREVLEESGIRVTQVLGSSSRHDLDAGLSLETSHPIAVVAGLEGAYPALLVVYECIGTGTPRPVANETAGSAWWAKSDVVAKLTENPDDFVWQSAVVLRAVLAGA